MPVLVLLMPVLVLVLVLVLGYACLGFIIEVMPVLVLLMPVLVLLVLLHFVIESKNSIPPSQRLTHRRRRTKVFLIAFFSQANLFLPFIKPLPLIRRLSVITTWTGHPF